MPDWPERERAPIMLRRRAARLRREASEMEELAKELEHPAEPSPWWRHGAITAKRHWAIAIRTCRT